MSIADSCLLAIDTSTTYLSLGVRCHGHNHLVYQPAGTRQSELILPAISGLLHDCGIAISDIDTIIYAQGPGAFTGLRIGMGVAEGLATPFSTPLMAIPCLDAVASLAPQQDCVLAATDARMNEVFYAWYDTRRHQRLSDYCVGAAGEISLPENHRSGVGVGNAFALDVTLPVAGEDIMPTAEHYLALALSGRYPATDPAHAELRYVRNKIALTASEQAARRAQHA